MTQNPWELGGPTHPQALGAILRDTRLALGRSLEDAERQTRILVRHLAALEAGEFDQLPPGIYARGFMHNYAAYLRLNPQEMVRLFVEARGEVETYYRPLPVARPMSTAGPIAPNFVVIVFVVGMLAVVTAWGYTLLVKPPKTSAIIVEATQLAPTPTVIIGRTITPSQVATGGIAIGSASVPTATATPAPPTNINVTLKATAAAYMQSITVDGQAFKTDYSMKPGETLELPPGKAIVIKSAAPGAVKYSVDGMDKGTLPNEAYYVKSPAGFTIKAGGSVTGTGTPGATGTPPTSSPRPSPNGQPAPRP